MSYTLLDYFNEKLQEAAEVLKKEFKYFDFKISIEDADLEYIEVVFELIKNKEVITLNNMLFLNVFEVNLNNLTKYISLDENFENLIFQDKLIYNFDELILDLDWISATENGYVDTENEIFLGTTALEVIENLDVEAFNQIRQVLVEKIENGDL